MKIIKKENRENKNSIQIEEPVDKKRIIFLMKKHSKLLEYLRDK